MQPALLELFRKHRELFLPKNVEDGKELRTVRISSPFIFLGPPGDLRSDRGPGSYVMVICDDDVKARLSRWRTIVFAVDGDGKLDADYICFGGSAANSTYGKFFDAKWAIEHTAPEGFE